MKQPNTEEVEILSVARKRLSGAISAYSESRQSENDDLKFFAGSPDNNWQWPDSVISQRGAVQGQTVNARPSLTINKLPQHVRQVTNDQRQNRPAGKVIPADDKGDVKVAEVYEGMIKHIEYISDADVADDTACENQVTFGEGYFRIITKYCDDTNFDQDILIRRVRNSFSVYLDPTGEDSCGEDCEWGIISEDILKEDFERTWPNARPISSIEQASVGDNELAQWIQDNTIRIIEYFYTVHDTVILNLYPNNMTSEEGSDKDQYHKGIFGKPTKSRQVDKKTIKWCKTNGYEILESTDWPGKYIPIIRVVGNEYLIDGRIYYSGLIRNAKDAQRMYNYWVSQEAEMLALAPKAPFIAYGGQIQGYEHQWKTANTNNWSVLEVNPQAVDGQGAILPLPQRSQPPLAQNGLIQAKMGASDDSKSTTGQYDSSLGATSTERSGKAISARERQGDVGTYHYIDNLARAVRYRTRQIIDLIPKIYDTQRIARIIGADGEVSNVKIDPSQKESIKEVKDEQGIVIDRIYNPGVGKYDVCVTTGPSYMTKRQEASDNMTRIIETNPQILQIAGDILFKNMDWPGADQLAQRFAKTIDPKLLAGDDESPEMQAANQQIQQMGQELDQVHEMMKNISKSIEVQDQMRKEFEAQVKAYDAETKRITAIQASMSPEQIEDSVLGTVHSMMSTGELMGKLDSIESDQIDDIMSPTKELQSQPGAQSQIPPEQLEGGENQGM